MPDKKKKRISMLSQVALLFAAGVILISLLTSLAHYVSSDDYVREQLFDRAYETATDLDGYIRQYPASDWLLRYWFEHYDEMEIEYDADYSAGTLTAQKCRLLAARHPEFLPEYAAPEDVEALPAEDQKLYAEIVYSWLITRIDQMAVSYAVDYLFCVVTEEPYDKQLFLFIASENDLARGTGPDELYPIGRVVNVSNRQQEAMRAAVKGDPQTASRSHYIDYYYSLGTLEDHQLLIGVTRDDGLIEHDVRGHTVSQSLMSAVFLLALGAVCLLLILFVILRPLRKVQKSIRLYKNTKDSAEVIKSLSELRTHNEIAQLSNDVADLAREIDDYTHRIEAITSERERIKTELDLASRLQTAMLPRVFPPYPDRQDFEIYASMSPAREVGGDFYDFFLIDDNHLCLVIADVSGKGIPAALFMMAAKITLSHTIKTGKSPAETLTAVNVSVCSNNPENMFVTVWLGILDLADGTLTAANAGHEYPILKKAGGDFELIKDKHGFVIGGMDGVQYKEYELQMEPGSTLFLYTDGLTEATNARQEMFGTDRVVAELNRERDAAPEKLLANMKSAVDDFVQEAEQFDDLTMLCLTYQGAGDGSPVPPTK